jgi:hypothetical protein
MRPDRNVRENAIDLLSCIRKLGSQSGSYANEIRHRHEPKRLAEKLLVFVGDFLAFSGVPIADVVKHDSRRAIRQWRQHGWRWRFLLL